MGVTLACKVAKISRSILYRRRKKSAVEKTAKKRKKGSGAFRALSQKEKEKEKVLDELHSEEYIDKAPAQVYASLLDKGVYHCSVRTMYRILAGEDEVRERRNHKQRSHYKKPELLATGPNQVWSWDITRLKGPKKWTYYYLYVILDIYDL